MPGVQLYVKYPDTTNWIVLDQFSAEPIKLNFSVSNIIDPLQVSSIFSRTFRVPHTSINGPFFRAVFNVNSVSFDASRKADAYINDNGALFSVGNIRLDSIYRNEKSGDIQYEIIFYGETSDFGSKIGGGFLSEVDLSAYNHTLNYLNITNSWSNGLFGGDIVYPLCEWGYDYENGVPLQTTLAFGGANGFVGPSPPALAQNQFKPVIRAKALWDAIFEETGYTYDSTFLNSTEFTNLYVITESTARATLNVDNTFSATNGTQDITTGTCGYPVQADTEISDPNNNWNPVTGIYVARATGAHTFTFNGTQWALPPPGPGSYTFTWTLSIVDADTLVTLATTSPTSAGSGYNAPISRTFNVSLTSGQRVAFKYCVSAVTVGIITSFLTRLLNVTLRCTVAPEEVTMTSLMPNNIKKIDFMRSIINQFKLVFVPDRDIARKFEITPWKDWILQGTNKDWTAKLDGSKDMKIKPLFYGQERFQIYRYLEDADFVNLNYGLVTKQTYGQLNQESENELITGTKETVLQFAPTPLLPIGNANPNADPATDPYEYYASEFLIPHLAKDTNTERSPIQPKLRLVYYNGMILVPDATQNWKLLNDANAGVTQTRYPLVSQYSAWPPNSSTFDLSWENEAPLWNTEQTSNPAARTPYDTFNVYWKTWYDTTFDPYSRIVEANFVLEYNDIYDIKFNDYVFVIDAWYVVNKIVDYIAGQITNCKVELIKVGNSIGLTIPPSVELYTPVSLCLGFTACEAFCCNGEFGYQTYYVDGTDLSDSNFIYSDIYGSIPVIEGIYSDGTTTVGTAAGGVISTVYDTSGCDCEPAAVYSFEVCYATEDEGLCVACCCTGDTVTVYGTDPTLVNNTYLYTDAGLTSPAPNGNYYDDSVSSSPFTAQVGGGEGQVQAIGVCTSCECNLPELYELTAEYATNEFSPAATCDLEGLPIATVWGDGTTWALSTEVYADAFGISPAAEGNYLVGTDVFVVDATGTITSVVPCFIGLLNTYDNAEVGYSLRKINSTSTYAVTIRRSSDDATQDIGFVGEDIDTAAITSFVGANSAFVTKWWDQSGNGNHLIQSTPANQPRIVNAGVIETAINGKTSMVFDGVNDFFDFTSALTSAAAITEAWVFERVLGNLRSYAVGGTTAAYTWYQNDNRTYFRPGTNTAAQFGSYNVQGDFLFFSSYTSPTWTFTRNNSLVGSLTYVAAEVPLIYFGRLGSAYHFADQQEYVLWETDRSADKVGIQNNINAYWTVY